MKNLPKVVHEGEECFFNEETKRLSPVERPWESIALSDFQYAYFKAMTTPVFFAPKH